MIVIINGPLGIGKSETSWELLRLFERAIMLDGDYLGAVQPFEIYDPGRVEYLYQTLHHVIAWHGEHGYRHFVVNYVFETPESLARLRHLLADLDDEIYAFRLTCAENEIESRIRQRSNDPDRLAWELHRFRELAAIQDVSATRGDLGFVVDTTSLTAAQVARAIWDNIHEGVRLVPYDPLWPAMYAAEAQEIDAVLGELALEIHHIGSTAVPGLATKAVIDLLVAVRRLEDAAACIAPLQTLGYTFVDYPQNTDRRFFRKGLPRTHHLHIVAAGSPSYQAHLDFRDALRAHPEYCQAYAHLKNELAEQYRNDRAAYSASKTAFIEQILAASSHPGDPFTSSFPHP